MDHLLVAGALWLAFGSGCDLKNATDGKLEPIWPLDDPQLQLEGFRMNALWDADPSHP